MNKDIHELFSQQEKHIREIKRGNKQKWNHWNKTKQLMELRKNKLGWQDIEKDLERQFGTE